MLGKAFDLMLERNLVSWTGLISEYVKAGCSMMPLHCF